MKLNRYFYRFSLLILLPALGACGIFGGETSLTSEKCYTNPQPAPSAQLSVSGSGADAAAYVPGRLLVSYRSSAALSSSKQINSKTSLAVQELKVTAQTVRQRFDLRSLGMLGSAAGAEIVRTPPGADVQKLAAELRQDPRVAYAEPDYYLYSLGVTPAASSNTLPDDPFLAQEWNMLNFGLPQAWALETGKSNVVLAVLDSGVDVNHEDLKGRTLPGCDVYNGDNDPSPGVSSRNVGTQQHGTHVAGIALASGNNSRGVAGVAYTGVRLLPVKVFDDYGGDPKKTSVSVVVKAIRWAAGLNVEGMNRTPYKANIINLSLGIEGQIDSLNQAVQDARNAGVLVVAAAGNRNSSSTTSIFTPANAPGALAVGSVDQDYRRSYYSAYSTGGRTVDLMAPGGSGDSSCGGVLSTLPAAYEGAPENNYGCEQGTSMASPFVAGVAALIWSQNPGLSADEVEAKLKASAAVTTFMNPAEYGAGVVCADRALGAATLCGR